MDSITASSAQRGALCSLLCLCLFLAGLLLGSRPFFPTPRLWEHFSRAQQQRLARTAPPPAPPHVAAAVAAAAYHDHDVEAPAPDAGYGDLGREEVDDEEMALGSAPAPAPAWEDGDGEGRECDLLDGSWVHDPAAYPLYQAAECPFLSDQVTCRRNGRPDAGYEQWRWQPRGCGSARFRGAEVLEQLRNRRLVFVGDSLNRNMWESLACIIYTALPDRSRTRIEDVSSEYRIFRAMDYNCSVEFFWSPFLVKLETKQDQTKALKLDQLPTMLKQVVGADVIIFNTGHWWTHTGKLRAWDHLERNGVHVEMEGEEAFNRALRTWAKWVDHNIDPTRTKVFFRSISPEHKSANWCYNQTTPIINETIIPWFPKGLISIVERNIQSMKTPATYLNITHLSELRIDAHPSVYTTNRDGKPLSTEQRQQPITYADCSHWCLPGLPDTWNVILLASLRHGSNVH
ncbi:protein trichome birefringence-like 28 [Lolium rigidum]|uniref:protein trichome birefringence-like 28 n=1 Tax=Lolium rigidum TaxID=89674 RepID=UPI001F5CCF64|nr:protein trichome birefringence-like 28 [Lolium rigidum]